MSENTSPEIKEEALLNTDTSFNRFNDAYVKYLLATEKHKRFLLDLINAVFDDKRPACISGKITDLTLEDRELSSEHIMEKHGRLDIRAQTDSGELIDIEVQTYADNAIGARELFYFSKLYTSQLAKGLQYYALKPVVIINLMAFNHFKEREQYHSCYELRERDLHDVLSDKISVHFIEAQKCKELSLKNKNRLVRWMKYLTYSSPEEVIAMAKEDEVFTKVLEAEKMFVRNREEMLKYEARERYEMDLATRTGLAEARGEAKGRAEGEAKGRAEGKFEALLATAKKLLTLGMPLSQIKQVTNLSDEELIRLQQSHS